MNSGIDLKGSEGVTTETRGEVSATEVDARSSIGSSGMLG